MEIFHTQSSLMPLPKLHAAHKLTMARSRPRTSLTGRAQLSGTLIVLNHCIIASFPLGVQSPVQQDHHRGWLQEIVNTNVIVRVLPKIIYNVQLHLQRKRSREERQPEVHSSNGSLSNDEETESEDQGLRNNGKTKIDCFREREMEVSRQT